MNNLKSLTTLLENNEYTILNEMLLEKLRHQEVELSDLLVLSHLKISEELNTDNAKLLSTFKNNDLTISIEGIVHLNQEETLSIMSEFLIQSLSENTKLKNKLREKEYVLLGLLFYNCQAYNLLLVSMIFNLLLLFGCNKELLIHTVEFINWQKRKDGSYGYYNPLLSNKEKLTKEELYKNFVLPNTFYCKVLLKSYEVVREELI